MRSAVFVVVLLFAVVSSLAAQSLCIKCTNYRCNPWTPGYTNCASNGSICSNWGVCSGGGGGSCDMPGEPTCEQGALSPSSPWMLASVDVVPAPRRDAQWRLASVDVRPARAKR